MTAPDTGETNPDREPTKRLRRAVVGAAAYMGAGAGARLLQLLAYPLVMRAVAPEVFGKYVLIRVALFLFRSVTDLGTSAATVRYAGRGATDQGVTNASVWWGRVALAGTLSAATLAIAYGLWPGSALVAGLAAGAFFTLSVDDALVAIARAQERHRLVATAHVVGAVVETASLLLLVWMLEQGLVGLVATLGLRFLAALALVAPPMLGAALGRPSWSRYVALLRFGIPAAVAELMGTLGAMDRWLIERVSNLANVAAYHLASIPGVVVEVMDHAIFHAAEPWVYGTDAAARTHALQRLTRLYFAVATVTALAASLAAPEVLLVLAPPEYGSALSVIPWLTFATVLRGGVRVVGIAAGVAHHTRPWAVAGLVDLSLLAILIVGGVPHFGVLAAGIARFVAAAVGLIVCHRLSELASKTHIPARLSVGWAIACAALSSACIEGPLGPGKPLAVRGAVLLVLGMLTLGLHRLLASSRLRKPSAVD